MDKKQKILIVDDNNDNLKVAANILKSNDNIIWLAVNGKTAIEIAKIKQPDLILLDIQMPEMDGLEVCKRLKEDMETNEIPVIFMTARTDVESIKEAFEVGAADYITKPIKQFEIIARVKTQLKLTESIKELKETIIIKDKFFSIIAHDLKGPIGGMASLTKIIYDEFDYLSLEEIKETFQLTSDSSDKIYNLLTNLLEWAKSQTGIIKCEPEPVNLTEIINKNIELSKISMTKKNILAENKIKKKYEIFADKEMINTIIRNLLSNAIKFTSINGKIELGAIEKETFIKIYVKDNGIGMSQKIKEKLFKIDEKIISIGTEGEKGNGIGLSLCYEFVKSHGWEIEVESEKGEGSEFMIIIPKKIN